MKRYLLGGVAAAGLLLGGLAVNGGSASADEVDDKNVGDVYACPAGSTSDYKVDNLNGETYTVPQPSPGKVIVAVVVKASTEHRTYSPVTPGQVLPVKADMGHNISHAHICEEPPPTEPPPTEPPPTEPPPTEPPPTDPPPTTAATPTPETTAVVAAQGPVPPAAPPAPAAATAAATPTALPSTGSSSWGLALTALASLLGGLGLVKLSRRTS